MDLPWLWVCPSPRWRLWIPPQTPLLPSCQEQNTIIALTAATVAAHAAALWDFSLTPTYSWERYWKIRCQLLWGLRKVILPSLYRFKDSLSVFSSFQADLFPDQVCVLPLHLGTGFGLRFNAKQVILVSQVHFMFNSSWEVKKKQMLIQTCLILN